jgi:hypothetical protein
VVVQIAWIFFEFFGEKVEEAQVLDVWLFLLPQTL